MPGIIFNFQTKLIFTKFTIFSHFGVAHVKSHGPANSPQAAQEAFDQVLSPAAAYDQPSVQRLRTQNSAGAHILGPISSRCGVTLRKTEVPKGPKLFRERFKNACHKNS